MKTTRLAARRAKPISWVTTTIVMPSRASADHDVEDLVDHLGVEGRRRLVEEHDLRVHGQRPGDGHPLLLAAGQLGRVLVGLGADADPVEQLPGALLRLGLAPCPRTLIGPSVTFCRIVLCAKRLKLWNTMPTSLRSRASSLPSSGSGWPSMAISPFSIDSRRLIVRQSVDLPEPGRPDDDDDLAAGDLQVDVLQHVQFAEPLVDAGQADERLSVRTGHRGRP